MDSQRSKKARSLGVDPPATRQPASATAHGQRRSEQGDKYHSAPVAARRRQSDAKRSSDAVKLADRSKRATKPSSRDESSLHAPAPVPAGESQTTEQRRGSAMSLNNTIQVSGPCAWVMATLLTQEQLTDRDEIPVLKFAVVGNASVGKSVFIRNALDLRRPSTTPMSTTKVLLGGTLYRLELIEISLDSVGLSSGTVQWPSYSDLGADQDVDGVLCLYDVSDQDSLEGVVQFLTVLEQIDKITCLVSCKVDIPLCDHEVGSRFIDEVSTAFPKIAFEEATIESSDTAKRCLLKILRETIATNRRDLRVPNRARSESDGPPTHPPRRSSRNTSSRSPSSSRRQADRSKSRDNLLTAPPPPVIESEDEDDTEEDSTDEASSHTEVDVAMPLRINTANARPRTQPAKLQTPISSIENGSIREPLSSDRVNPASPETPESLASAAMLRRGSANTAGSHPGKTFLDMDDESPVDDPGRTGGHANKLNTSQGMDDAVYEGTTFLELVERLLAMPASKGEHKFISSFLCLYRAFATPLALLMAIMNKFVKTERSDMIVFTKTAELLRYLSVLGLWTAHYPGDFADTVVRETAIAFVAAIEKNKSFAPAAKQIANNLQTSAPDEDDDWAFAESTKPTRSKKNTSAQMTASDTTDRQQSTTNRTDGDDSDSDDDLATPSSARHSATTSSASSVLKSSGVSSQTLDNLHNLELAREQVKKLRSVPQNLVSKTQWHQFMTFSTDELAIEITRTDWTMYTAIRPRDFVRYVTVSNNQRSRPGHPDYIGMMTKRFNHLALFVSGMILVRDKPKHRARTLEKFMNLAWKVRQMNNYHALGAIVAALNSEEIVRLSQTQELIPKEQHKEFLRLKILMSHQKSHAAYRMAWENSSGERIPYLPRIQEDLTKAALGNSTFVNDAINWKKFEILGETVVSIQRSQEQPYNFPDRTARGHEINKLILGTKVLEGNEVSANSVTWVVASTDDS